MARKLNRKRAQSWVDADQPIIQRIETIKQDHPAWGYRRVWSYIRYRDNVVVGKNRIYRLMKALGLLMKNNPNLRAKRYATRRKPRAKVPNQYWGMDMTKVRLTSWGWIYIHCVLDWYTKEIIGYHVSATSKSADWLEALHHAVNTRFPNGIHSKKGKPKLITDNGCQPTSESFMKVCSRLKIKQIFTTWNNPKGNADTERLFRTMKEDLVWPNEWHLPFEFLPDFEAWVHNYNTDFPHQSLRYQTPAQLMQNFSVRKSGKEFQKLPIYSLVLT
jgi:transposase InsO family protein